MKMIDLNDYPAKTEEVLLALWERKKQKQGQDDKYGNEYAKRRMVAGRTSLNKGKVRHRLNRLVEDDFVSEDIVTEHNQQVNYYALRPNGVKSAKAIEEAKGVLGDIPEEVGQQDILTLTYELATARAEAEIGRAKADSSVVVQRFNEMNERLENLEEKIEDSTKDHTDIEEDIIDDVSDNSHNINSILDMVDDLENRIEKIENGRIVDDVEESGVSDENNEDSKDSSDEEEPGLKDFFQPP